MSWHKNLHKVLTMSRHKIVNDVLALVTYALMGREKDARVEGAEVLRIDPKFSIDRYMKGMPGDQPGKGRRIELLQKAGLK